MQVYQIINPSDPYTIEAECLKVLTVSALALGSGKLIIESLEREPVVPFFFGGVDEWSREKFGVSLDELFTETLGNHRKEVVACLRSVLIGRPEERGKFLREIEGLPLAERLARIQERHESRRTSTNDIGGRALQLAAALEGQA